MMKLIINSLYGNFDIFFGTVSHSRFSQLHSHRTDMLLCGSLALSDADGACKCDPGSPDHVSRYTNKEIFLRELISNASDALDKARFMAVKDKDYLGDTSDLKIQIHVDKENKVVHITDTGVGMTKSDLIRNLGTIAKSGTSDFLSAVGDGAGDTSNLIGQFGVGFYSAFLVADTVVVTSKHNDDKQHIWESDASSYSLMEDNREGEELGRGTRISLYLKEEAQDFLETKTIKALITKYSEFINFDIYLYTSKVIEVDAEELEEDEEEEEEAAEGEEESEEETEEEESEDGEEAEVEDEEEEDVAEARKVEKSKDLDDTAVHPESASPTRSR